MRTSFTSALVFCLLLFPASMAAEGAEASQPQKIACELEGNAVSAGVVATSSHAHSHDTVSKSLWGNLLLGMAYQQDTQLQAWMKALHRYDAITLASVTAISGLGLAQGITGLVTLQNEPHPKAPGVMGIISAGGSLGTLAVRWGANRHYGKLIAKRQTEIRTQIQGILGQLKDGAPFANVQPALVSLVGDEATQEFSDIWQATHH